MEREPQFSPRVNIIINGSMVALSLFILVLAVLIILPDASVHSQEGAPAMAGGAGDASTEPALPEIPEDGAILAKVYPWVDFSWRWIEDMKDWELTLISDGLTSTLFHAGGRYLSKEATASPEKYRRVLYRFPGVLRDPAAFSAEELARLQGSGASGTRLQAAITSSSLFDAIYHTASLASAEEQLVATSFLGKRLRIHRRVQPALASVETRIRQLATSNKETALFVQTLDSADGFNWRPIRDTAGKSFHSMGLALDLLPQKASSKNIYWNWRKQQVGDAWPLTALESRWTPGEAVIAAFEAEGFIWGGYWAFWDNMHFEYRPELIAGRLLFEP